MTMINDPPPASSEHSDPFADSRTTWSSSTSTSSEPSSYQQVFPPPRIPAARVEDEITPVSAPEEPIEKYDEQNPFQTSGVQDPEKATGPSVPFPKTRVKGTLAKQWARFRATYAPVEDAPLVLPSGPTDEEKYSYLKMNRVPLCATGVFSFLALSAGMWLFVITSVYFYWFGFFVVFLEIYLIISYTITMVGKGYDFEAHQQIIADHPILDDTAPTVDIYLPCCKEPLEILDNTYKYVSALQWPTGKLKVHVMDDGAMDEVRTLAESYGFNYSVRGDRPRLQKAGNLRWTFARTSGDFFVIFDADFCPRPDFLMELIPLHLADEKIAIVQSPQFFRVTKQQTWIEQGAGGHQEFFYRVVQVNRNRWGASICVGSNAVYRREALAEVGGTAEIGFSEDVHTGFYAVDRGWKIKYVPLCLACGICPDTPQAFFSQQMRWCMGSTTLLTNRDFWRSNLTPVQKLCYTSGMMYYSAVSLGIFINPLPGILLLWIRPEYFKYYNLAFAIPSICYTLLVLRFWARGGYSLNVQFIMVIQSYAYLTAVKARIFGRVLAWVPSGDNKSHRDTKYRHMRILCWCWNFTHLGVFIAGLVWRSSSNGDYRLYYHAAPLLVLDAMNLFFAHRFMLYNRMA